MISSYSRNDQGEESGISDTKKPSPSNSSKMPEAGSTIPDFDAEVSDLELETRP